MAKVTIQPSEAKKYRNTSTTTDGNHWIGTTEGLSGYFSVRYTFKSPKKLKGFTAKINATRKGNAAGNFRYCLSTSDSFPSQWVKVTEEASSYLSITYEGEVEANTTYYLFVSKSTAGNYAYYTPCTADNVTITGETAGGVVKVAVSGEVKDAVPKVYKNGGWEDIMPRVYRNGTWEEMS